MKIKSWIKYFIYTTIIFILIILREYIEKLFIESYYRYEDSAIIYYTFINFILGICIGLFLGIEHFINELKKDGKWKINLPKLIIVGLPTFYFSLTTLWSTSSNHIFNNIIARAVLYFLRYGSGYEVLFQIAFGYVVLTSFSKHSNNI